jgi:hypothetical protein
MRNTETMAAWLQWRMQRDWLRGCNEERRDYGWVAGWVPRSPFLAVDADVPIVLCGDITQNKVRLLHEEHVQYQLHDTGDSRQCVSASQLHTQHQRGMPKLYLVASSGVQQSGETTVRAAISQPRRSSIAVTFSQWPCNSGIKNNIRKRLYNYIITVLISFIVINIYWNWNKSNIDIENIHSWLKLLSFFVLFPLTWRIHVKNFRLCPDTDYPFFTQFDERNSTNCCGNPRTRRFLPTRRLLFVASSNQPFGAPLDSASPPWQRWTVDPTDNAGSRWRQVSRYWRHLSPTAAIRGSVRTSEVHNRRQFECSALNNLRRVNVGGGIRPSIPPPILQIKLE